MKNIVVLVICLIHCSIYAQEIIPFSWGGYEINFEDTSEYNYVAFDTNNIWFITKPDKQILFLPSSPTYLNEYAIISDTNDYYSKNVKSSFQFKLFLSHGYDSYYISFWHKYDFEKNKDGGIIETSYDNGLSWQNIIFDTLIIKYIWDSSGLYNYDDTIGSYNNHPGFTGLQPLIRSVDITFWNFRNYEILENEIDTLLLRFTIVSDSIDVYNEGWMLDNFVFGAMLADINEIEKDNNIFILPNPSNSLIKIDSPIEQIHKIEIFSLIGKKVLEKHNTNSLYVDKIPAGIYLIKINNTYIKKLVIK